MMIYFARHAESEANVHRVICNRSAGPGLTERGAIEARQLAAKLLGRGIERVLTSPLLRARATANIVGEALSLEVTVTDALVEFDCGEAEGRSDEAAWEMHANVMREWLDHGRLDARISGGESFHDIRNRFIPVVQRALEAGQALLVSHGAVLQCMLPLVLGNVDQAFIRANPLAHCGLVAAESTATGLRCVSWQSCVPEA